MSTFELAQDIEKPIPMPITFQEFIQGKWYGRFVDKIYFDELQMCLALHSQNREISDIVIDTSNMNVKRLSSKSSNQYEKMLASFCEVTDVGEVSDGYHTFNELYYQRMMLFATIVNMFPEKSWKTKRHEDGEECFGGGWFLVTIDTPEGAYGYHYEMKYWDKFMCKELRVAKHWDGYTEDDVTRLMSLVQGQNKPEYHSISDTNLVY